MRRSRDKTGEPPAETAEKTERRKLPQDGMRRGVTAAALVFLVAAAALCMVRPVRTLLASGARSTAQASASVKNAVQNEAAYKNLPWNLIVVNRQHLLPRTFTVDLEKVGDIWVDQRVADPLRQMIAAAARDGVTLTAASGYRSVARQTTLYRQEVAANKKQGFDTQKSTALAEQYMQTPGASEHHTGLAVDINTPTYRSLDAGFAGTMAFQWLQKNAPAYGFVIRYPLNKQSVTGILYEPWHYRYVGREAAQVMNAKGLCLEEYVQTRSGNGR